VIRFWRGAVAFAVVAGVEAVAWVFGRRGD
jgi:hypothetical protein